jgi:ComF family protein
LSNERALPFDCGPARRARIALRSGVACAARIIGVALPQHCELCVARTDGALVCAACASALPRVAAPCPICGLPSGEGAVCGACLSMPPPYAATVGAFVYAFPVDRLLQRIKYGGSLALAAWAGSTLAAVARVALSERSPGNRPDRVVALPLGAARQRERGFNQAAMIAAPVAAHCALALAAPLVRIGGGLPQTALPWAQRRSNIRGAFAVRSDVRGARIALVDDVMTTGATLAEAARTLLRAGAARVECWIVARTLRPGERDS